MKKAITLAIVCLFVPAVWADATPDGAAIYKNKCAICHGPNGEGSVAMKTAPYKKDMSEADIVKIILNGKNKMPAFKGKLSPDELSQVAKHVKSLGK
jgi:cytochrome c6